MENLIYKPKREKHITFDDFVDNTKEYDSFWVEMSSQCYKNIKIF